MRCEVSKLNFVGNMGSGALVYRLYHNHSLLLEKFTHPFFYFLGFSSHSLHFLLNLNTKQGLEDLDGWICTGAPFGEDPFSEK